MGQGSRSAKETAEEIHRVIHSNNGVSEIRGSIPLKIIIDAEKYDEYIARETLETSSTPRVMGIFNKWVSGHFPPWVRLPALEFVQRAASVMMGNLVSEERNTFDIYVSHDTFIGAFLLFWFGVFPSDLVKFLDGFILQFDKGEMVVHSKFGMKKTLPPYWWSF